MFLPLLRGGGGGGWLHAPPEKFENLLSMKSLLSKLPALDHKK